MTRDSSPAVDLSVRTSDLEKYRVGWASVLGVVCRPRAQGRQRG